jgi:sialate O-acetylesterase
MTQSPRLILTGALALWLAGYSSALADVKLPAIFGDHMVLQQDLPVPVWGTAAPGEAVAVTVGDKSEKATTGADGKWSVKLPPLSPTAQAATMTVAGNNTVTFKDVLIGEVWVCSGQSNMEFGLAGAHNAQTELPKSDDPQMRLFHVAKKIAHTPAPDVIGSWELCSPATARGFTAVGHFFGKELRAKLNRPVGLIETDWGGTPAEAWTSLDGLKQDPALAHYVTAWNQVDANYEKAVAAYPSLLATYNAASKDWTDKYGKDFQAATAKWQQASRDAVLAKLPAPAKPVPPVPMPQRPSEPAGGSGTPAALYNGMVQPLQPYAIRGAIWYQGEANAGRAGEYRTLFPRMIKDWRRTWAEGDFPFLWVQLAAFGADDVGWPALRDAQAQTLSLPKTGMATAIDIGLPHNIHPMDKEDVGKRLALAAEHVAYGQDLVYSGPTFQAATKDPAGLRVTFENIGSGLDIEKSPWIGPGADVLPTDHLVGFELAGADGKWLPADAKIDGSAIVVSGTAVSSPAQVRYDWKGYPEGNLYNKEGLPAPPFHGKVE